MIQLVIVWVLCTAAFLIGGYPAAPAPAYNTATFFMHAVAGLLVAIAIALVSPIAHGIL